MKRSIVTLFCAIIAPVAFAQTTDTTKDKPGAAEKNAGPAAVGTVTDFTVGQTITVKTDSPNPMSFAIAKSAQFANKHGKKIKPETIRPGAHVHVYYEGGEDTRKANRIVVDD